MKNNHLNRNGHSIYRKSGLYLISILILFISIGILTTAQPAYRFSSSLLTEWTRDIDGFVFYNLLSMENRAFKQAFPEDRQLPKLSSVLFQVATNLKPDDPRSLLGNEIPGFSIYDRQILIAGEGTNYTNLPFESSPPLEEVLRDREALIDEPNEEKDQKEEDKEGSENKTQTTDGRKVVYIYNTHTRESFLPHLPDVTDPDLAFHGEVNITKVSDHLAKALEAKGIGAEVEDTDIDKVLNDKGMKRSQAYDASREYVEEAIAMNDEIQFVFDLHRDSARKDVTTKEINGESYARIMFVVGMEHPEHEKNIKIASELHDLIEEKYPGISRGVVQKEGSGVDGIYNQDLSDNAVLIEFGGVDNNLDELYRAADAVADVFSDYYWDAEAVQANP
ncbi:stage II sporulation protein P [Oceanobacillus profundus]|uniref:Stage II sporulation protein P n=1 Tax=Oceanobacillus profundus TaxID=372463 RepID=A0A417YJL7_9BACI|nr:stage II sporulation protein P [Oceanobacillus profundus]RHW33134.1 stage II sporulation protein P [Oceanobacillus profundus]